MVSIEDILEVFRQPVDGYWRQNDWEQLLRNAYAKSQATLGTGYESRWLEELVDDMPEHRRDEEVGMIELQDVIEHLIERFKKQREAISDLVEAAVDAESLLRRYGEEFNDSVKIASSPLAKSEFSRMASEFWQALSDLSYALAKWKEKP